MIHNVDDHPSDSLLYSIPLNGLTRQLKSLFRMQSTSICNSSASPNPHPERSTSHPYHQHQLEQQQVPSLPNSSLPPLPRLQFHRNKRRITTTHTHRKTSTSSSTRKGAVMKSPKLNGYTFTGSQTHLVDSSQIERLERNSIYLTFNAPKVDEYHRGIFLAHPSNPSHSPNSPESKYSGTLLHAAYTSPESTPSSPSGWHLESRPVRNISTSTTLVLLYRLATLTPPPTSGSTSATSLDIEEQFERVKEILRGVPLGKEERERKLGRMRTGEGNPVLEGYDCIVWTADALRGLVTEGWVDLEGRSVEEIIAEARSLAGPPDARTMVGKDFGGIRVIN